MVIVMMTAMMVVVVRMTIVKITRETNPRPLQQWVLAWINPKMLLPEMLLHGGHPSNLGNHHTSAQ